MNTVERSAALAQALKLETQGLPPDFAKKVAALAEADRAAWHLSWTDAGLIGGFAAVIAICVAGWIRFGEPMLGSTQWLITIVSALAPHPWLIIGMSGVVFVQLLTFRRRTMT